MRKGRKRKFYLRFGYYAQETGRYKCQNAEQKLGLGVGMSLRILCFMSCYEIKLNSENCFISVIFDEHIYRDISVNNHGVNNNFVVGPEII